MGYSQQVEKFYKWFIKNKDDLFESKKLQDELTKKLIMINSKLSWEIGPGEKADNFLAFSPNLNKDLLALTSELALKSPQIQGWEFFDAKPRKKNKRRITLNKKNKNIVINYEKWLYFLTSFNDNEFFDVNIVPKNINSIEFDNLNFICDLLVQFELGEKLYMDLIDRVNVVSHPEEGMELDKISVLYEHLKTLIPIEEATH